MLRPTLIGIIVFGAIGIASATTISGGGSKRNDCAVTLQADGLGFPGDKPLLKGATCADGGPCDSDGVVKGILDVYDRNVFPDRGVTWGTYANNLGHMDSPGCFRCHDDSHKTADGKDAISQDCGVCHQDLAMDESSPDILKTLGLWDDIEALKGH